MPRAEDSGGTELYRVEQEWSVDHTDIPVAPAWNLVTGESCVESEMRKSRVPIGCVSVLLLIVLLGSNSGSAPAPEPASGPEPAPTRNQSSFASCKHSFMDCNGTVCGVVVLETGMGKTHYKHDRPSVHGLWPQNGRFGTSACISPNDSTVVKGYLPYCYNNSEAKEAPAHQQDFVEHEWTKHGMCSGARATW